MEFTSGNRSLGMWSYIGSLNWKTHKEVDTEVTCLTVGEGRRKCEVKASKRMNDWTGIRILVRKR